jgi:hypothetical protein
MEPVKGHSNMSNVFRLFLAIFLFTCPNLRADLPLANTITLQLSVKASDFVWDTTRSRFLISAGTNVLVVDPETGAIESTVALGEAADRIAVSGDGQLLYASVDARGVIKRYRMKDGAFDLEISLGRGANGQYRTPSAIAVVPGQPQAILVSFAYQTADLMVYDGTTARPATLPLTISSAYVRPSDHSIYGWGGGRFYVFRVDSQGVAIARSAPAALNSDAPLTWNGGVMVDFWGQVFDLDAGVISGRAGYPAASTFHYPAVPSSDGNALVVAQGDAITWSLVQYSLTSFRAVASSGLTRTQADQVGIGDSSVMAKAWGSDGAATCNNGHSSSGAVLTFIHTSGMQPVAQASAYAPTVDPSGVIHVPLQANGIVFDKYRNLLWATIPGSMAQVGNAAVSIDPTNGNLVDIIDAGSEPGVAALSGDGSHLFTMLGGSPAVSTLDLNSKQRVQTIRSGDSDLGSPISIAAIAGESNTLAVAWNTAATNYASKVTVYDGGVARKKSYSNFTPGALFGDPRSQWVTRLYAGDADNALYGADLYISYGGGSHDLARFLIDPNGISLDTKLNPLQLGGGSLVYDSGYLFTGAGEVRTPDTQTVLWTAAVDQSYASAGIPVPLVDHNQVAYLYTSGFSSTYTLTLFDLATGRPTATIPVKGSSAAVRAGSGAIAILSAGEILLVPLGSLQPWPQYSPVIRQVAAGVRSLNLSISAMTGLPGSSRLVLALPPGAGNLGNSIAILNPNNGQIESSAFIGSQPTMLRTAADGSAAYAYLAGEYRIGRYNISSASRDLVFTPDPTGGSTQYQLVDMALGPDGGVTASFAGGWLATFDSGVLRPSVDKNTLGLGAFSGAPYQIALNPAGTIVYGYDNYWSFQDFKREAVTPDGIHFLSGTTSLVGGEMTSAGGLLFGASGNVVDPEKSRLVGRLAVPAGGSVHVAPDLDAGRIYAISGGQLLVFDSSTYAMLGSLAVGNYNSSPLDLVRYGPDGLAFRMADGELYLVQTSAIPLLVNPVRSPQPTLPVTPGVTVVDLAAKDLAYDASRNLIYATVPNSEAANGDRVVAIDPGSGSVTGSWPAATNPKALAISDDQSHLYFTSGTAGLGFYSGYSPTSEGIHDLDLNSGAIGPGFPSYPSYPGMSFGMLDLAVLPGEPKSVAAIDYWTQSANGGVGSAPNSLRIFDDGTARPEYLLPHTSACRYVLAGATAARLYCSDGAAIWRLAVDANGVSLQDSLRLLPGKGAFGHMIFRDGKIYTTTGNVVDAEGGQPVTRVNAQGPVATDGSLVYWLDPGASANVVTLRAFDIATLQPAGTKQINVTNNDLTRLISCGQGRVAFRAGNEVYIVTP